MWSQSTAHRGNKLIVVQRTVFRADLSDFHAALSDFRADFSAFRADFSAFRADFSAFRADLSVFGTASRRYALELRSMLLSVSVL